MKAILQYTAQPLPGANLLQQGTGQLNVEGAVRLAAALRTDISEGKLKAGDRLLAAGKTLPAPQSTIAGQTFNWGRLITAGGNQVLSGDALFSQYQPIWIRR